jgi:hypothetical protein
MNAKEAAEERVLREYAQACDAERAKLTDERDQLVGKLARLVNETGARLRVLTVLVTICKETLEKLGPENPVACGEAFAQMQPLLAALKTLPPLTPLTMPVGTDVNNWRLLVQAIKDCPLGWVEGKVIRHRSTTDDEVIAWIQKLQELTLEVIPST